MEEITTQKQQNNTRGGTLVTNLQNWFLATVDQRGGSGCLQADKGRCVLQILAIVATVPGHFGM
jgi:hypothetical protein